MLKWEKKLTRSRLRSTRKLSQLGIVFISNKLFENRLYTKAVFTGFKRGKSTQHEQFALLKVKGVNDKKDTSFYFGKRVAYIYKAKNSVNNTRFRSIWGRIVKPHGNNGAVRAKFARNLPARAMGATLRVMLFPNRTLWLQKEREDAQYLWWFSINYQGKVNDIDNDY